MSQNPFSIYDFLGYLIPGGVFLYLLYFCGVALDWDMILQLAKFLKNQANIISILDYASLISAAYILGHFVAIASAFFIEKYMNETLEYPSIYLFSNINNNYKSNKKDTLSKKIKYIIIELFLFPVVTLDFITCKLLYSRDLPEKLATTLWDKIEKRFTTDLNVAQNQLSNIKGLDGDLFRLAYHYTYEYASHHQGKIQNYVALYGFCRNICFVMTIMFWISVYAVFYNIFTDNYLYYSVLALISTSVLLYVFYCGFVKFYRRFTLEVLMAFAVIKVS
ncbi:hypothetical protein SMC38_003498 [Cronobacter sakazakii]|nr:hypothetical protein [Cronobacter sakazakii]